MRTCGTRARYVFDKCRCEPCTQANRDYARARYRARQPATIPADKARRHIRHLSKAGVGLRTVSDITGIARSTLARI